jgi:hypothetical protein
MMYYCEKCRVARGFPKSTMTESSVQCDFCDSQIRKCHKGSYANLVGLEINPETFKTSGDSIKVTQILSLPNNLSVTKIHSKEKKHHVNDKVILVFENTMKKDGATTINVVNRQTGEQVQIKI